MLPSTIEATRAPLALLATAFIAFALTACSDDQFATAPRGHSSTTAVAERNATTLASDSTLVTFSPEREARIFSKGYVGITGTIACSRDLAEPYTVVMKLQQDQQAGVVESSSQYGRTCPPAGEPFIFYIDPVAGGPAFKRGKAVVTFEVVGGGPLVIHSSESRSVRLVQVK